MELCLTRLYMEWVEVKAVGYQYERVSTRSDCCTMCSTEILQDIATWSELAVLREAGWFLAAESLAILFIV
jgi:hypothetical protein